MCTVDVIHYIQHGSICTRGSSTLLHCLAYGQRWSCHATLLCFLCFFPEMEAKDYLLVLLFNLHFLNAYSLSSFSPVLWLCTHPSVLCIDCLSYACFSTYNQLALWLFPTPHHILTKFLSSVYLMAECWWDFNSGNMACNLWSNQNSCCCCCSVFLGRWT